MEIVKELPEVFEEFGEARRNSFLTVKEYKEKGIPMVGSYCTYFPQELAMAIGAVPVSLCSTSDETIGDAEKDLPRNLCPLIKSSYGFATTEKCPFFYFSDLVVGETTCDGKKKMYEFMSEFKDVFVMRLPNYQDGNAQENWRLEILRLKEYMEKKFGRTITDEDIRAAVRLNNRVNRAKEKLASVMKQDPAPIQGYDLFKVLYGSGYRFDKEELTHSIEEMTARIEKEYAEGKNIGRKPRILITGCPIGGATEKVIQAVEKAGGVVVAYENCNGEKSMAMQVDEGRDDIYDAIAERYLQIGCSVMSPNKNRFKTLDRMIDEYQVDGVVEMVLHCCITYDVESAAIRRFVTGEKKKAYLGIDTDYSSSDIEQINTRVAGFLEML